MKKIIFILIFFGFLIKPVYAVDLDVNCRGSGVCTPNNPGPIFLSSEVWYPGKIVSRSIKLLNTSGGSQKIITQSENNVTSGDLSKVFTFSIVRNSDNQVIWSGSLDSFYNKGEIELVTLGDGVSDTFIYTAAMDSGAQNEYQGKETKFDLKIGFAGVPSQSPSSVPSDYSNELSATLGGVFIEEGPAEGFIPGVLGEATPSAEMVTTNFPWWIFVGGSLAIVLAFLFMIKWKHDNR